MTPVSEKDIGVFVCYCQKYVLCVIIYNIEIVFKIIKNDKEVRGKQEMKNQRMSTTITIIILIVNTLCISLLYFVASSTMTTMMKQSEKENLHATLNVQTNIIKEFIKHEEDLLMKFGNSSEVIEFLKNPNDEQKRLKAQAYTERYYAELDNWEGLYIGEWDTHVIAHSNPEVVGMTTRTGEPLKQLQNEMSEGLYNAGIIISPASSKLVLSLYYPVYDPEDGSVVGYVGGGPFAEELDELLAAVVDETTTYYMLNVSSGMYIFAQDNALMATEVEDEMLLSVLPLLQGSEGHGDKEYYDKDEGASIAAYYHIPEYDWVVVSCNSEKNIYADVNKSMNALLIICIFFDVLLAFLSWIIIRMSTKPLKYIEEAINRLKLLKLEKDQRLNKYINNKSEVGQIASAIDSLYDSIDEMLDAEKEKQKAIAASESKDLFLASMSHEIRTPINTVLGMNEMILRENKDETIQEYAYNIKSASQMLLGLINDVLDFSKIEAGKLQIVESDYQVMTMLKEAVLAVKARAEEKGLTIVSNISPDLPTILFGDEIRIKQILNNLLSNAAKYTEKGSITFSANGLQTEEGFSLVISVEDTGIGIKEEDMPKLFDNFRRLEIEKNRYIQGTGLGLYITKWLVTGMNGQIKAESEYGKGSCFTVTIPQQIVSTEIIRETRVADKEFVAPDAKVLVVDDNKMNLTVMKGLLKRSKVQADFVNGGNECLQMTREKKYDLIIMDHMMPEPDGIATLHLIRAEETNLNYQTPIVVLTANAVAGIESMYRQEGFAGYLSKPVNVEKLEAMMAEFCYMEN